MEIINQNRTIQNLNQKKIEAKQNYLESEPNNYTENFFTEHLLAIEMTKMQIRLNKCVYLGLPILELSKILMYEFWYDYLKLVQFVLIKTIHTKYYLPTLEIKNYNAMIDG